MLVAGKPDESLLVEAIRYDGEIQMPPKGKLADSEIAELTQWVQQVRTSRRHLISAATRRANRFRRRS